MSDFYIKDILTIEKWLSNRLAAKDSRVISGEVYNKLKDSILPMDEVSFKMAFSKAVHTGILDGFIIKKGKHGGVFLSNADAVKACIAKLETDCVNAPPPPVAEEKVRRPRTPKAETNSDSSDLSDGEADEPVDVDGMKSDCLTIRLSPTLRIHPDKYNWCLQRLTPSNEGEEETWLSFAYWSTLNQALEGVARKILDKKLKLTPTVVGDLKAVAGIVKDCQQEIVEEIKTHIDIHTNNS